MGLIAHYRLDDLSASIGSDLVHKNNSGKLTQVSGMFGDAYSRSNYADSSDYLEAVDDLYLPASFTFACWAYVTAAGSTANGLVTNHSHSHQTGSGITVKMVSADDYRLSCNTGTGSSRTYNAYYGTSNIKDRWAHLVVRYDAPTSMFSLWVNGVKEREFSYPQYNMPDKLQLFSWSTTYTSSTYRPGSVIDDVRIYDHALSPREVRDLSLGLMSRYRLNGDTTDEAGTGLIDIGSGAFIDSDIGVVADVAGTRVNIPLEHAPLNLKGETIVFREKCDFPRSDDLSGGFSHYIIQWGTYYGDNSGGFGIQQGSLSYYLRGPSSSGWTNYGGIPGGPQRYDLGGWIDYAVVFGEDDTFSIYMDGDRVSHFPLSVPYTGLSSAGIQFGTNMLAKVSDVRIYATALTPVQVKELYQQRASIDSEGNFYVN